MKNMTRLLCAATLAVAACATPEMVKLTTAEGPSAFVQLSQKVIDRHDAYVIADSSLDSQSSAALLAESAAADAALAGTQASAFYLSGLLEPVMVRHDAYVQGDASLLQYKRDTYLETSATMRKLLSAAMSAAPAASASPVSETPN